MPAMPGRNEQRTRPEGDGRGTGNGTSGAVGWPLLRLRTTLCRLNELSLLERTDRAALAVGAEDVDAEPLLVKPNPDVAHRVCPDVGRRDESCRRRVRDRQSDLERDRAGRRIVTRDVHGRDDNELAGRDPHEVDQRHLLGERSAERAVVGLVDRSCSVVVEDRAARWIDVVVIRRRLPWRVSRGKQRERGRASETPRAVDPVLQRAEAPALAGEPEPWSNTARGTRSS